MNRKHSAVPTNEIQNLFANPEIALITGFSLVVGAALLAVVVLTINAAGVLLQTAAAGAM